MASLDTFKEFIEEALSIIGVLEENGVVARLMGALAVNYHCPKYGYLHEAMQRTPTDIDFASYWAHHDALKKIMPQIGYNADPRMFQNLTGFSTRYIFLGKTHVDIFFDQLEYCHRVDLRGRLELDKRTIPLSDLLLAKLQIVKINEKDIKDAIILLLEHDIGDVEEEEVNAERISGLLSKDWGFYYTATTNLQKIQRFLNAYPALSDSDQKVVSARIDTLLDRIEKREKTYHWKMRAKVGTRKKWYMDSISD